MNEARLHFLNYNVTNLEFKLGENFGHGQVEMNVNISRTVQNVKKISDTETDYELVLNVILGNESDDDGFFANVTVRAQFQVEQSKELLLDNATAIIFPYLRSAISTICVSANIPTLILPTINVIEYFNKKSED